MKFIIGKIITRLFVALVLFFLVISCATVGKPFNYQNRDQAKLGKTTINDAIQLFGSPKGRQTSITENHQFETIHYVTAKANLSGAMARSLVLEFKDNILNAKVYNSGFKEDNTGFNISAYQDLKIGKSTQEDVLIAMGMPSGMAVCPTKLYNGQINCGDSEVAWIWENTGKSQGLDVTTIKLEIVKVIFDKDKIVKEVDISKQ